MNLNEATVTVRKLLEGSPKGLPLRTVMKEVDISYYQLYNILSALGYGIKDKNIVIKQNVKFIVKR